MTEEDPGPKNESAGAPENPEPVDAAWTPFPSRRRLRGGRNGLFGTAPKKQSEPAPDPAPEPEPAERDQADT